MKTKLCIIAFLITSGITRIFSFNAEPVLESNWYGWSKQYTDLFENGYVYIQYKMYSMNFDSYNNTLSGKFQSKINIEGYIYETTLNINGTYDPNTFAVKINPGYISSADILPNGLYWVYNKLRFTLYSDSDNSGYYLLQGYTLDDNGYDQSQVELSNNPSYA